MWLGLGSLALDLILVVVLTSLLRHRLPHRAWRSLHLLSYPIWAVALAHGIGIGTDARSGPGLWTSLAGAGMVALAVVVRLGLVAVGSLRARRAETAAGPVPARAL